MVAECGHDELGAGLGGGVLDQLIEDSDCTGMEPDLDGHGGLGGAATDEPREHALGLPFKAFLGNQVGQYAVGMSGFHAVEDDLAVTGLDSGRLNGESGVQVRVESERDASHSPS